MSKLKYINRIRELRQEAGLTREELAEASGVRSGALGHYERGDTPLSQAAVQALTSYFGCSSDFLLAMTDSRLDVPIGSGAQEKLQALLDADAAAGRDCCVQYEEILQELLDLSAASTAARQELPEDPEADDLAAYYSKVNEATAAAAAQIRLMVSMELYPALIKTKK